MFLIIVYSLETATIKPLIFYAFFWALAYILGDDVKYSFADSSGIPSTT